MYILTYGMRERGHFRYIVLQWLGVIRASDPPVPLPVLSFGAVYITSRCEPAMEPSATLLLETRLKWFCW